MTEATAPLYNGVDSATPGHPLPRNTRILCVYIGAKDLPGQPDARHVWTIDEINQYMDPASKLYGGPDLRVLPIFVHDYPGDPATLANNCCDAAVDLGWSNRLGRLLVVDFETLIDPPYVGGVSAQITDRGFRMTKYGSQGTINQNPPVPGGTWMATDSGTRPAVLPADRVGEQWLFDEPWDFSVFDQFVYDNCGVGPRKARP